MAFCKLTQFCKLRPIDVETTTTTLPTTNDGGDEDGGDEIDDDEGHNSQVQRCFSRAQKFPDV